MREISPKAVSEGQSSAGYGDQDAVAIRQIVAVRPPRRGLYAQIQGARRARRLTGAGD